MDFSVITDGTFIPFLLMVLPAIIVAALVHSYFKEPKPEKTPFPYQNPYRTPAEMPATEPEPKSKPKTKSKRNWKMSIPAPKLGKYTKTFALFLPVCAAASGVGFVYDSPLFGVGLKWGTSVSLILLAVFFFFMTLEEASHVSSRS